MQRPAGDIGDDALPLRGREPIDLAHLRRCTAGDDVLGQEIIALFHRNASAMVVRIAAASDADGRRQAGHSLKGSALAVGAWEVARLASAVEAAADDPEAVARYVGELMRALERTRSFAERLF
jgi:HPt (histidine-containing phosphotransfer) domain-containing protein